MTISEYFLRLEAIQLQHNDQEEMIHLQAWTNQMVQATKGSKKNPKPKFTKFEDFYNHSKIEKGIRSEYESGIDTPEKKAKRNRIMAGKKADALIAQRRKERRITSSNNIQFKPL
ncbi:hypothetical protein [Paucilactobacillus sp. N302-9]